MHSPHGRGVDVRCARENRGRGEIQTGDTESMPKRPARKRSFGAGRTQSSFVGNHPSAAARESARGLQDVPRQGRRLYQGGAETLAKTDPARRPRGGPPAS